MSEKSEENFLPNHIQQSLCTTRLPYRQGRKLTAIKVYTINNESKHLLVFGVPSLNLRQETKSLFIKFGKLIQFNITNHTSEQFTETYHAIYEDISSARIAKRMLDTKNFYGGVLHVCYAPELENIDDTRQKLMLRQKHVIARLRNLQKDLKNPVSANQSMVIENKIVESPKVTNKVYMGDINSISLGKRKAKDKKLVKKSKNTGNTTVIDKNNGNKSIAEKEINDFKMGTSKPNTYLGTVNNCNLNLNILDNSNKNTIDKPNDFKNRTLNTDEEFNTDNIRPIEVIDFTSAETETLTNINEALNYNNFGKEIIKKVPYKPVNKIQFNLNKKT